MFVDRTSFIISTQMRLTAIQILHIQNWKIMNNRRRSAVLYVDTTFLYEKIIKLIFLAQLLLEDKFFEGKPAKSYARNGDSNNEI